MPTEYSGDSTAFPATVTLPSDLEADDAASINDGLSDLADRTAFLAAWRDSFLDLPLVNWATAAKEFITGDPLDTTKVRPTDDTAEIVWSNRFGVWVVCGSDTAGFIYAGDAFVLPGFATSGAVSPPKVTFGVDTAAGKVLLFNSDLNAPGVRPKMLQSGTVNLAGGWTTREVTTTSAPETVTTNSATYDAVRIPSTDRVLVVGGRDGRHRCWKTDDAGDTFTEVMVSGVAIFVSSALNRVLLGRGEQIIAFSSDIAANGGGILHVSNDRGDNWFPTGALPFDEIADAIYVEDLDLYFFVSGEDVWITDDPTSGSGTWTQVTRTGIDIRSIVYVAGALVIAANVTGASAALLRSRDGGSTWSFVRFMANVATLNVNPYNQIAAWVPQAFSTSLGINIPQ